MIQSVGGQPPGGPGGPPPSKPMTEDAKKQVTDILSQYDSENLSSDDMDAINKSFKDAGIRPSGELKSMLEDSGFDAKALGDRARQTQGADGGGPPPGGPPPGGPPPGGGAPPGGGTQQASADQLKQLSSTLDQYDLNNLSEDDKTNINQKLSELGFSASKSKVSFTV
jgi:hypothetical protein